MLQYHFNWKTISVAAGMTFWNFYFQIFDKAVGKEETVVFLAHLLRHLAGPLLIVWDRLPAHRSRLVGEFLDSLEGQILVEYLPPYAPELNPVEYLWGYWKHHQLPNVCAKDFWQLSDGARRTSAVCAGDRASSPLSGNKLLCLLECELYYAGLSKH